MEQQLSAQENKMAQIPDTENMHADMSTINRSIPLWELTTGELEQLTTELGIPICCAGVVVNEETNERRCSGYYRYEIIHQKTAALEREAHLMARIFLSQHKLPMPDYHNKLCRRRTTATSCWSENALGHELRERISGHVRAAGLLDKAVNVKDVAALITMVLYLDTWGFYFGQSPDDANECHLKGEKAEVILDGLEVILDACQKDISTAKRDEVITHIQRAYVLEEVAEDGTVAREDLEHSAVQQINQVSSNFASSKHLARPNFHATSEMSLARFPEIPIEIKELIISLSYSSPRVVQIHLLRNRIKTTCPVPRAMQLHHYSRCMSLASEKCEKCDMSSQHDKLDMMHFGQFTVTDDCWFAFRKDKDILYFGNRTFALNNDPLRIFKRISDETYQSVAHVAFVRPNEISHQNFLKLLKQFGRFKALETLTIVCDNEVSFEAYETELVPRVAVDRDERMKIGALIEEIGDLLDFHTSGWSQGVEIRFADAKNYRVKEWKPVGAPEKTREQMGREISDRRLAMAKSWELKTEEKAKEEKEEEETAEKEAAEKKRAEKGKAKGEKKELKEKKRKIQAESGDEYQEARKKQKTKAESEEKKTKVKKGEKSAKATREKQKTSTGLASEAVFAERQGAQEQELQMILD